jgi:hypothetical protein
LRQTPLPPTRNFRSPQSRTWGSNLLRERPRAYSTLGEAEEAASKLDVVEVAQEAVEVVADAEHLHNKFRAGLEASPHLSMARQWRLYLQQEHGRMPLSNLT